MKIVILRGGGPRRQPPGRSRVERECSALAVGASDGQWVLLNVSAAVALQLDNDLALQAHPGLLDATRRAVVLTDARIDHVAGLIGLRGGSPIDLYATPSVFETLTTAWPVLPVLQHYCDVHWHVVPVAGDSRAATFFVDGLPTLEFTAIAVSAPAVPHESPVEHPRAGDHIALAVRDLATGQRVFCAPGLAPIGGTALDWMREADCLLIGGPATSAQSTPWMDLVSDLPARLKVLLVTDPGASAESALADRGIALAYDGMEIEL